MSAIARWAELEATVNGRVLVGMEGVRDPDFRCEGFRRADQEPKDALALRDCDTDGHYLCDECVHISRTSRAPSVARVALRPDMLQIDRLPGVRYTVEMLGDLPPPAEVDDSDDSGVRAAQRRLSPQVGDFARVLFDDSVYVLVEGPPRGVHEARRLLADNPRSGRRPPRPLWTKADLSRQWDDGREWAVILVNMPGGAFAPSGFRVGPDGRVALLQIFQPREGVFWNSPFVLATCNTREAAQAVVDALLDAAQMFDPRPFTLDTKVSEPEKRP